MGRSRVAVVIPAHNCADTLANAVNSVLGQSKQPDVCLIVDDGSSDNTLQVANELAEIHLSIQVLPQMNGGPSAARNAGIIALCGKADYVWFLDSDDLLTPSAIQEQALYLDQHPEVVAVGGRHLVFQPGQHLEEAHLGYRSRYVPGRVLPRKLRVAEVRTPFVTFVCDTGQGPFYLFRTSAIEQIGGYDKTLWAHEDADILCRLSLVGEIHYLSDRTVYAKCERPGSMTTVGQAMGSGTLFEAKWNRDSPNCRHRPEVLDALKHKSLRHVPFRDLKVAAKFTKRALLGMPGSAPVVANLLVSAVRGFSGYNWKVARR